MNTELVPHPDPEVDAFEQALLRSLGQAVRGEYAVVHLPIQQPSTTENTIGH